MALTGDQVSLGVSFYDRCRRLADETVAVKQLLAIEGSSLLLGLCGDDGMMSLREVSRQTGHSPTYLSKVMNGQTVISLGAYIKLFEFKTRMEKGTDGSDDDSR